MRERLRLQPNEEGIFGNWFRELAQGEQRVAGGAAAGFLKKSGIPTHQLKQIWDVCDASRMGSIDEVHIASACTQALSAHMCTHLRDPAGGLRISEQRTSEGPGWSVDSAWAQDEFFLAMRLVAIAQNGVEPSLSSCHSFQVHPRRRGVSVHAACVLRGLTPKLENLNPKHGALPLPHFAA